jgi:hypothetical protein
MSKSNIKYLIIPDLHGRDFWREPVMETLQDTDAHIIYLGDFHDPYPQEFRDGDDYLQRSVDQFKEIIGLKKRNPRRMTLLIGNHDCGYAIGDDICSSRMDRSHRRELENLFQENKELFQLAEECDIAGRHIIFSHAGILKGWAKLVWGDEAEDPSFNVVDRLNNAWLTDHYGILDALGDYDIYRGWGGFKYGSPVWSDIRSWIRVTPEETYGFNIVGHTQLERQLVLDTIADLDCRKVFYLDDQGVLRSYDTDEECTKETIPTDDGE